MMTDDEVVAFMRDPVWRAAYLAQALRIARNDLATIRPATPMAEALARLAERIEEIDHTLALAGRASS